MAILEIPVRSDLPAYVFQITLEGTPFTLHFRFNTRLDRWVMDVNDVNDVSIVSGTPMLTNLPLLDRYRDPRLPLGRFLVLDETGQDRNPSRDGFGEEFKLLYEESTTVEGG